MINKFIAEQGLDPNATPTLLNSLTLNDLLNKSPDKKMFETGFGTVKVDANLSEAKDEMEKSRLFDRTSSLHRMEPVIHQSSVG